MSETRRKDLQLGAIEKLRAIVPFDDNDLAINKRGKISDAQQKRLKPKVDLFLYITILAAFVMGVMTLAVYYASWGNSNLVSIAVLLAVFTLLTALTVVWSIYLKMQWIRKEGVRKVTGYADLEVYYPEENSGNPVYSMKINGVKFKLTEELYGAFIGEKFRIYYFRILFNEILTIEAVD